MTPEPSSAAEEMIVQAKEASRSENWEKSLEIYDRASSLPGLLQTPGGTCQWARIQINRGVIFHRLGRMPQARDAWMAALRPGEVPGLAYLQCVASGYILGLSDRSRPEWMQGWKQVLSRYAPHEDGRIPPRLFEFFFAREWEFEGIKPGLGGFFRAMAGLWNGLIPEEMTQAAWVYHSLPLEEKARVLPFWETAPPRWAGVLWGGTPVPQLYEPEFRWLGSRPGMAPWPLPSRWTLGPFPGKWPAVREYAPAVSGIRLMGSSGHPWAVFDDGRRAYGASVRDSEGTFLDLCARSGVWAGIRKRDSSKIITAREGIETEFLLPEDLRLVCLDARGRWAAQGISGAFYREMSGPVPLDVPPPAGRPKKIHALGEGLLVLTEKGESLWWSGQGDWEAGLLGEQQILWSEVQDGEDLLALGTGAWVEIWEFLGPQAKSGARPQRLSRSPESWDMGRWGREALAVWSAKAWGSFELKKNTWYRQESSVVLHSLWMSSRGPVLSDRKGRWKSPETAWQRAHGNWINGLAEDPRGGFWTGDLEGQLVLWTPEGRPVQSLGPAPTLSADWLDDRTFVSLHPGFLRFWDEGGEERYFYGHGGTITALAVKNKEVFLGDAQGQISVLDAQGKVKRTFHPGLGGITVIHPVQEALAVGGAEGGWGLWTAGGPWTLWGTEGITALHPWRSGWAAGYKSGHIRLWTGPDIRMDWPEVHRAEVMSLAVQGEELFSAGADGRVLGWTGEGQLSQILRREKSPVWDLKPCGRLLLARTEDKDLCAWNLPGTGGFKKGEGHRLDLTSLDVHPSLQFCVTGGAEGWVRIWTLPDLTPLVRFDIGQPIARVRISPQGHKLLVWTTKGSWRIWDLESLETWFLSGLQGK